MYCRHPLTARVASNHAQLIYIHDETCSQSDPTMLSDQSQKQLSVDFPSQLPTLSRHMSVFRGNLITRLLFVFLFLAVTARPVYLPTPPSKPRNIQHNNIEHPHPSPNLHKRAHSIFGLPTTWIGVFDHVTSVQSSYPTHLVIPAFQEFYYQAARAAQLNTSPCRRYERFVSGCMILEFMADDLDGVVTREFVLAVSLWLSDAAAKGWTDFFRAWILDTSDNELIHIQMGLIWNSLVKE